MEGKVYLAGNEVLVSQQGISISPQIEKAATTYKADGSTLIYLMDKTHILGCIVLSDTIRDTAPHTIRKIEDIGLRTVLLTGDVPQAAKHMANMAGIQDVHSSCLPEDKLRIIRTYQEKGIDVCMVGDGINDAPALKAAQVGIAMGNIGSDIAIEAADIALVKDSIEEIPHLLTLSKKVMRTIHINLAASMLLNFVAIALAITGILSPVVGALVHNVGSVAVIINSSLLLKWRNKQ